jgi:single-strand DNA-binding protein
MALPKIEMTGRVIGEPKLTFTKNNTAVLKWRMVSNKATMKSGEWVNTGECWLDVVLWENADTIQINNKQMVAITGELSQRSYEAKDGSKRTAYEVTARTVEFPERPIPAPGTPNPWESLPPVDIADVPF